MSTPTQPNEAHFALLDAICVAQNNKRTEAAQVIADSEARAVAKAFPDSGDDSLYNVRRLRAELAAAKAECERLKAADCIQCDGKGWYADGDPERPYQQQCQACNGTGMHETYRGELTRLRALSDQLSDNLSAVGAAYNAEKARAEKAEAAIATMTTELGKMFLSAAKRADGNVELRRRAEKAEAECLEQARLLGMSASREASLLGKISQLERQLEKNNS